MVSTDTSYLYKNTILIDHYIIPIYIELKFTPRATSQLVYFPNFPTVMLFDYVEDLEELVPEHGRSSLWHLFIVASIPPHSNCINGNKIV